MVGGLEALRRVAAVGLLALGSVVPHNGPLLTAPTDVTPVADTSLACLLTVGTAFFYDSWATGPSASRTPTVEQRPMVNWDVVDENWRFVRQRAREAWTTLSHKVTS